MTALKFTPQDTVYVPLPGVKDEVPLFSSSSLTFDYVDGMVTYTHEGVPVTLPAALSPKGRLIAYKGWVPTYLDSITLDPASCVGRTIKKAEILNSDALRITFTDGLKIVVKHDRACCEQVDILDQWGDVEDLDGGVVVTFEIRTRSAKPSKKSRRKTSGDEKDYTFYEIRTTKGDLTLRWGHTNAQIQYGEEVTISVLQLPESRA